MESPPTVSRTIQNEYDINNRLTKTTKRNGNDKSDNGIWFYVSDINNNERITNAKDESFKYIDRFFVAAKKLIGKK